MVALCLTAGGCNDSGSPAAKQGKVTNHRITYVGSAVIGHEIAVDWVGDSSGPIWTSVGEKVYKKCPVGASYPKCAK